MIQRIFKFSNLINRTGFHRGISGVQSLFNNTNTLKPYDDDISEEVISATRKIEPPKKNYFINTANLLINENIVYRLRYFLSCTEDQAEKMLKENPAVEGLKKKKLSNRLDLLYHYELTNKSIIENPFLLTMDEMAFKTKLILVNRLLKRTATGGVNSKDLNDVVPLIQVTKIVLARACRLHELEMNSIPQGSRIYFLSKNLNVEPALVSKYFATHMFMFGVPIEQLKENLETLLTYNIDPIHILRDLWVFKYDPEKIKERFEICKRIGRENLRPWMVRCKIEVLEHSNEIFQQNKNLLGEKTVIDYLSKRLNYDQATMKLIVMRHPSVLKCRVTKIKEVLDYLLDEAKFEPYQIANVIRVLTHSLETTKERIDELSKLGCRPSTLTIICRSQNMYNKFIQEWIEKMDKR